MMQTLQSRPLNYIAVSLSLISTMTFAQPSLWQGPYIGVYGGGAFGNTNFSTTVGNVSNSSYFSTALDIDAVMETTEASQEPNAVIGGVQAGHDWVWKQLVYGVVLDYGTFSLNASSQISSPYPNNHVDQYVVNTTMGTNWLFTLRGRLGCPVMLHFPSLVYVTSGMAMTQLKEQSTFSDNSDLLGAGSSTLAQNQIGWTVGTGLEVLALDRLSMNIEYLYINVPSLSTVGTISNTENGFSIQEFALRSPFSTTTSLYANIFKIGLNYRFDE